MLGQSFTAGALAAVPASVSPGRSSRGSATWSAASCSPATRDPRSPGARPVRLRPGAHPRGRLQHAGAPDRKTRHLAAARYFESLGDDELAGALATPLPGRAPANARQGAEADALAGQARIALRAAAERAAALHSRSRPWPSSSRPSR